MPLQMTIDVPMLEASIKRTKRVYDAIRTTMEGAGEGEIIVSKRKKLKGEKSYRRGFSHGKFIANNLAKLGHDPFDYPQSQIRRQGAFVAGRITKALKRALRSKRKQTKIIQKALEMAARRLSAWARNNIIEGGLGEKQRPLYKEQYERRAQLGFVTLQYGNPPPLGILSGRFVGNGMKQGPGAGIRWRWREGRRIR